MFVNRFVEEDIDTKVSQNTSDDEESMEHDGIPTTSSDTPHSNKVDKRFQLNEAENPDKKPKKRKKGIIYVSNIPKHMNVTRIREILGQYGDIGRVFLQPEKLPKSDDRKKQKKKKKLARHFTEGWVEFDSKRVAKQIAAMLNNTQISTRKRSQFYDVLWSIKYLPRFKWVHLSERLNYEHAIHKQRLMAEVSQARKEATFFQNNLDKSEFLKKKSKKIKNKSQ